jgi:hypothetical protein
MLSEEDRLALREAEPALRRNLSGALFERAKRRGPPKARFGFMRVHRLVEAGMLRWVNRCHSAAVLTEDGARER